MPLQAEKAVLWQNRKSVPRAFHTVSEKPSFNRKNRGLWSKLSAIASLGGLAADLEMSEIVSERLHGAPRAATAIHMITVIIISTTFNWFFSLHGLLLHFGNR